MAGFFLAVGSSPRSRRVYTAPHLISWRSLILSVWTRRHQPRVLASSSILLEQMGLPGDDPVDFRLSTASFSSIGGCGGSGDGRETVRVAVRVRPLNEKEVTPSIYALLISSQNAACCRHRCSKPNSNTHIPQRIAAEETGEPATCMLCPDHYGDEVEVPNPRACRPRADAHTCWT